eukprot:maker-scaffold267_size230776-snap-gene-1.30 protein:Tk02975 transcript:maker-scaffold267_size230776-snap-gene-1.30-mRNA-1 annotation:"cdk10 11"
MDSEDDGMYDGPNIRPPQHATRIGHRRGGEARGAADRDRRRERPPRGSQYHRREREPRRDERRGAVGARPAHERPSGPSGDLRNRINRGQTGEASERGRMRSEGRTDADWAERKREDRLKRFMGSEAAAPERGRRDVEVRKRRKAIEKQMEEAEAQVKRKRERSAEGERRKRVRNSGETEPHPEEGPIEVSDDEVSGSTEEGEDSDTASEHSGATPERASTDEEEVEEEEESGEEVSGSGEEVSEVDEAESSGEESSEAVEASHEPEAAPEKSKSRSSSHHARRRPHKPRASTSPEPEKNYDPNATPVRSPTPLRAENEPLVRSHPEGDSDEEDSRLEAALRGELKDDVPEGTPGSQRSFGDDITKDRKEDDSGATSASKPVEEERVLLPPYLPSIYGCRSVDEFQCLNRIEEGTYGVVYRAKDKKTQEIVALKRLKMEREKEGFPITSLREINTLLISQHPNVVTVREIVVGSNMDKIYIVMDFVEHDLKSLMETMRSKKQVFLPGEVKCLMTQLLSAIGHLHDNWILHRDLKTSNLLLSHNGILKVGDFGLAREYGSPLKSYTSIVVTLWYRSPELLLGQKEYSTYIDVWSIGCILGELLHMEPLFPGKSDQDQLNRIFKLLGTPSEKIWPGYNQLPAVQKVKFVDYPISHMRHKFPSTMLSDAGLALLKKLLTYDPKKRLHCDEALGTEYFQESPRAIDPSMFPTWPAKSELSSSERSKKVASPKPPSGGGAYKKINEDEIEARASETGFSLANRQPTTALP